MRKPDNRNKDVAKSLHTVTVLYQLAGYVLTVAASEGAAITTEAALDDAAAILELAGRPDPYGLKARALALLLADQPEA